MTEQLGALLRRLRARSGLTQEQLEERSGVSVSTIRRLETGRSKNHRVGTLHLLADALEAGPDDRRRLAALIARLPAVRDPGTPEPPPEAAESAAPSSEPDAGETDSTTVAPNSPAGTADSAVAEPGAESNGPPPHSAPAARAMSPFRGLLADAVEELAAEVGRRWRREEEQRRVHDPYPLPVRWREAPESLTDYPENIQRRPSGATPRRMDLDGDVRSVAGFYRGIPSGRLVVLGRAGSGKSILTIRFVLDYLDHPVESGPAAKVPVIFSLGSWDPTAVTLRDWLVGRLERDHPHLARRAPGGGPLAAALVDAGLVLPVLDGFDEIAEGLRTASLEELNSTSLPLVLTSRRAEFAEAVRAAGAPLVWAAGIELTDLALKDLVAYLPRTARAILRGDAHGVACGGDGREHPARDTGEGRDTDAGEGHGRGRKGTAWDPVLDGLRAGEGGVDVPLVRVLSTPLMVALARTMYSEAPGRDPVELLDAKRFPDENALEEHLLAGFVPTVYRRHAVGPAVPGRRPVEPGGSRNPGPERAERWLGHLAHHLSRPDRDQQDLAWWRIGASLRLSTRVAATATASALCVGVSAWLVAQLLTPFALAENLLQGALIGAVAGVAFGAVHAVLALFGAGSFEPSRVRLRLPGSGKSIGRRPVRVFTARFGAVLMGGFVMGAGCACALALLRWMYHGIPLRNDQVIAGTLINMLAFGLIFGAGAGLVFGLLAVLEAPLDVASAATPAGLLAWNRTTVGRQVLVVIPMLTVAIALGGYLITGLLRNFFGPMGWGLADGLPIGVVGGLGGAFSYALSFTAWGQWVVLCRVWLPLTGRLPWNPFAFLDDAYRRGVLRRTGAVYQFRHLRLQHHLGRSYRERQARYAPARFTDRG
ncbi:helix-turn-helix domain-containing protein [Streptomyces sp. PTD5-9]|uniref:helix-turn-helix domain-containing protein n=1 Tax=Streptomyces sp. PTD5-9 TaxID=3120150 RepID=UPI0030092E6A